MDQIYIPKNREGFGIGSYVVLKPLGTKKFEKPYFYNVKNIEPIKIRIVNEIMGIVDSITDNYENIIITGSFLSKGFNFNDIDVIILSNNKLNERYIKKSIEDAIQIKIHLLLLNSKTLLEGLSTDPLYQMMLSKCIAKKRFIFKIRHRIDYKLLDLHLLKSRLLIDNFDYLDGNEKYYLVRNMIAVFLYLQYRKINNERTDEEIKKQFNLSDIIEIKQNMLNKKTFLTRYKEIYKKTFCQIMKNIKNGPKQK